MKTTILQFVGPTHLANGDESANHYHHRKAQEHRYTHPQGRALRMMLEGWESYAQAYQAVAECKVGDDGVLGRYWRQAWNS